MRYRLGLDCLIPRRLRGLLEEEGPGQGEALRLSGREGSTSWSAFSGLCHLKYSNPGVSTYAGAGETLRDGGPLQG